MTQSARSWLDSNWAGAEADSALYNGGMTHGAFFQKNKSARWIFFCYSFIVMHDPCVVACWNFQPGSQTFFFGWFHRNNRVTTQGPYLVLYNWIALFLRCFQMCCLVPYIHTGTYIVFIIQVHSDIHHHYQVLYGVWSCHDEKKSRATSRWTSRLGRLVAQISEILREPVRSLWHNEFQINWIAILYILELPPRYLYLL